MERNGIQGKAVRAVGRMEQVVHKERDRRTEARKRWRKRKMNEKRAEQTNYFVTAEHLMKNVLND